MNEDAKANGMDLKCGVARIVPKKDTVSLSTPGLRSACSVVHRGPLSLLLLLAPLALLVQALLAC
jgi:hypothetical protein